MTVAVAQRFARAQEYDRHAAIQRHIARGLAARIATLPLGDAPRVLEIGCGTGFLSEALLAHLPAARLTATDIAPAMLERTRQRLGPRERLIFAVMDGESPDRSGPFDLIASSLAFQWFADLPTAIGRLRGLLAPGGWLAFATLTEGSFAEWRAACGDQPCGIPVYPGAAALGALGLSVQVEHHGVDFGSARDFLRHLKGIGASLPRAGYHPMKPATLRQVMAAFDAHGAHATYATAICLLQN